MVRYSSPSAGVTFTGMSTSPERNAAVEDGRITVSTPLSVLKFQLKMVLAVGAMLSPGSRVRPSTCASWESQMLVVS